jgi:hypothetical protein
MARVVGCRDRVDEGVSPYVYNALLAKEVRVSTCIVIVEVLPGHGFVRGLSARCKCFRP